MSRDMLKPTKHQAILAVETLLSYIGVDSKDQHLCDTANRVVSSYDEIYQGYSVDIAQILSTKVYETIDFQDVILLKNIEFTSVCAHHMLPIVGKASVSYVPDKKIVGISKIVKVINAFARRLQIQENMTAEIACTIQQYLQPLGVAVKISASHYCMTIRGVKQKDTIMDTYHFTGLFNQDRQYRSEFINSLAGV